MNVYLWANDSFTLKADGAVAGGFDGCVIRNLSPMFLEAYPSSLPSAPIAFNLDYRPKTHKNAVFYAFADGYGVKLNFLPEQNKGFKLHLQKRVSDALITVYTDGRTRITAENSRYVETADVTLPAEEFMIKEQGDLVAVYSVGIPCFLAVFSVGERIEKLYANTVWDFEISPLFRTKIKLFDVEMTSLWIDWKRSGREIVPSVSEIMRGRPYTAEYGDRFLFRALCQRILNRLPAGELIAPSIRKNEGELLSFFGDFTEVLPDFISEKGVCLAYKREGTRPVKTFIFETEGGLVSNINCP